MRLFLGGIAVAFAAVLWVFALITAPLAALVMLVAGLAWDDRRRRRKTTGPPPVEARFSKSQ